MAFFKKRPSNPAPSGSGQASESGSAHTDGVRRRARHRLICATILVIAIIATLPWLLDVPPPRPVASQCADCHQRTRPRQGDPTSRPCGIGSCSIHANNSRRQCRPNSCCSCFREFSAPCITARPHANSARSPRKTGRFAHGLHGCPPNSARRSRKKTAIIRHTTLPQSPARTSQP